MLKRQLPRVRSYHPEYGGGLCNHLPMALIALDRMGATPKRLDDFVRAHSAGLEPAPNAGTGVTAENWREKLGERDAYPAFLDFFQREVGRLGMRSTLRAYLPGLARGVAAAAFHPMIRTAFGVIAEESAEVAVGLAYWASRHMRLAGPGPAIIGTDAALAPSEDPVALLIQLRARPELAFKPDRDDFIDRQLAAAAELPRFAAIVRAFQVDDLALPRLKRAAALLYLADDGFNSLHGLTAMHAAGVLADYHENRRAFGNDLWRALLALYLSLDRPTLPDAGSVEALLKGGLPDWNAVLPVAVASDDEHAIKLVYACFAESRAGGGRLYRYLAARKLGLLAIAPAPTESGSSAPDAAAGR